MRQPLLGYTPYQIGELLKISLIRLFGDLYWSSLKCTSFFSYHFLLLKIEIWAIEIATQSGPIHTERHRQRGLLIYTCLTHKNHQRQQQRHRWCQKIKWIPDWFQASSPAMPLTLDVNRPLAFFRNWKDNFVFAMPVLRRTILGLCYFIFTLHHKFNRYLIGKKIFTE